MSDRTDRKLREVAVAWYAFRHEAEFAAGFLDDAGIPFRMQVDDPLLGYGVSGSATIWVLGMHERSAREVLDLDGSPAYLTGGSSTRTPPVTPPTRATGAHARPRGGSVQRERNGFDRTLPASARTLSFRERGLAVLGGGGALALLRLFLQDSMHPIISVTGLVIAFLLATVGIVGWAPGPLRQLLRALSGGAP
jgi:hypothetical protein